MEKYQYYNKIRNQLELIKLINEEKRYNDIKQRYQNPDSSLLKKLCSIYIDFYTGIDAISIEIGKKLYYIEVERNYRVDMMKLLDIYHARLHI